MSTGSNDMSMSIGLASEVILQARIHRQATALLRKAMGPPPLIEAPANRQVGHADWILVPDLGMPKAYPAE